MRMIALVLTLLVAQSAAAQQFRVENEIYMDGKSDPIVKTLTLFNSDLVYDFAFLSAGVDEVEQATLYDFSRNRFIVLDYGRKVKLEVSEEMLVQILSELAGKVDESKSAVLKEMAKPNFSIESIDNKLVFSGKSLKYEVITLPPKNATAARDYQRFADWSARLTTALQNGAPPMARIKVNEHLANEKLLPDEVVLTRSEGPIWENAKKLRSKHHFNWAHTKTDAKRIETLNKKMAEFTSVKWAEFRSATTANSTEKKR